LDFWGARAYSSVTSTTRALAMTDSTTTHTATHRTEHDFLGEIKTE
jgi:hypothetical protein